MRGHLLDTSVISELTKASPNTGVLAFLSEHDDLWLSSVVLHELELGLQLLAPGQGLDELRRALGELTSEFGDRILPLGHREAEWAARLGAQARLAGHVPRADEALLSGIAKEHDLAIATCNERDFDGLDVAVMNPWVGAPAPSATEPAEPPEPAESVELPEPPEAVRTPEPAQPAVSVEPAEPAEPAVSVRSAGRAGGRALVAGVDGVSGGWVMAVTAAADGSPVEFSVWDTLADLWSQARARRLRVVAVDMPAGLPGTEKREADTQAHRLLGARRSSLFWTPPLCVLDAAHHAEANRRSWGETGRGISVQAFSLMPKIRELRDTLAPGDFAAEARPRAAEVHPETSFVHLAGEPMSVSKRQPAGEEERLDVLEEVFPNIAEAAVDAPPAGPPRPALDDLLDAAAAAWTARRIVAGNAECLGAGEQDETGYPMHIWV